MHTAPISGAAVDAAGRIVATGSTDKTIRIWSVSDGNLLQTIRVPAGPGYVGRVHTVAMTPDGSLLAAAGWGERSGVAPIYLFDSVTGKMAARIAGDLSYSTDNLVFSADGRYLVATLFGNGGLRVFDHDKNWSEAFRDTPYGAASYGAAFATDGRLATASNDGKIRLYDSSFKLVASQDGQSGHRPMRLAFSPNGSVLAVGYGDVPSVDLLDGQSLNRLAGPDTDALDNGSLDSVAWSTNAQTLLAAGRYLDEARNVQVLAWDDAGAGRRRTLSTCSDKYETVLVLLSLPTSHILVGTADPCLTSLEPDGSVHWAHARPGADMRNQQKAFAVSADGAIVDFGFEEGGKSPLRFDLHALALSGDRPADRKTRPPKQDGLSIEAWDSSEHPKLNGKCDTP
jgi:WD40 repeat protein